MQNVPKDYFANIALLKPGPVKWLWPGRIPLGHLTLIAGDPGVGKSTVATDLAARTSAGIAWPDKQHHPEYATAEYTILDDFPIFPAQVIYLTAQEDLAATLFPRLEACGAVHERIIAAPAIPDIDTFLHQLEALICHLNDVRLVIFDPLVAYLRQFESSRGQEAREVLDALTSLASEHQAAFVGITHKTRIQRGVDVSRLSTSVNITAAARAIWTIKPDPNHPGRNLFLPTKNNLAPAESALSFRIASPDDNPHVACVLWDDDPVALSDIVDNQSKQRTPKHDPDVDRWLLAKLASGPIPAGQLKRDAIRDGFSWGTVRRAKVRLHIQSELTINPIDLTERWHWQLPPNPTDVAPTVSAHPTAPLVEQSPKHPHADTAMQSEQPPT